MTRDECNWQKKHLNSTDRNEKLAKTFRIYRKNLPISTSGRAINATGSGEEGE